ncbi:uncharacterized protein LOC122366885 [Amphibalanus amphitrite]|uniref:uncharacterized protein LOC122366885 n=1 Tax=Amphibalanus amphitrite TaxID=1232801 RepID=UPI001C8FD09C|nr:uncharacterized protein LOC122366885 [Amphibalanus amphitrite]
MGVPVHPVCLLAAALLLATGTGASVFSAEQLTSTYSILDSRQCLPDDFDLSKVHSSSSCENLVQGPDLPKKCEGVPPLALYYYCLANSEGQTGGKPLTGSELKEAVSSMFSAMQAHKLGLSSDPAWQEAARRTVGNCQQKAEGMPLEQTTAYALLCIRWSLFADCDRQQQERGELDAAGEQRQAAFLQADCPLSPQSLKDVLEAVTGRTFEQCGLDTAATYEDVVNALHCLMENFLDGDSFDYKKLLQAIISALFNNIQFSVEDAGNIITVVTECKDSESAEDFFNCWINLGVLSCAFQEANQVAAAIPGQCQLSA